jgi:hypothetical protein
VGIGVGIGVGITKCPSQRSATATFSRSAFLGASRSSGTAADILSRHHGRLVVYSPIWLWQSDRADARISVTYCGTIGRSTRGLRWSLSKLRALLGPWLVASQNGITIAGEGLTVDVTAFRRLTASIRSEYDAREALALWRGEPLADAEVPGSHRFHLWWTAEREALTKLHCRVLHERVDRLWSSPCDALAAARSLVTRYLFDEWGHARVAQALKRTGRIPEARAYVEATRQTLSLELGLPPASVMMELPKEPYGLAIPRSTAPARERGGLVLPGHFR